MEGLGECRQALSLFGHAAPKKVITPKVRKRGSWKVSLGDGRIRYGFSKLAADKLASRYNRFTGTERAYVTQ